MNKNDSQVLILYSHKLAFSCVENINLFLDIKRLISLPPTNRLGKNYLRITTAKQKHQYKMGQLRHKIKQYANKGINSISRKLNPSGQ